MKNEGAFTNIYIMIKSIIAYHKIINPLLFTPYDYIQKRFSEEERESLDEINSKYEDLMYFLRKLSCLKLLDINGLLMKVLEVLSPEELECLNTFQKDYYNEVHTIYFSALPELNEYTLPILNQKIALQLLDIIKKHENQDVLLASNVENLLAEKKPAPRRFTPNFRHMDLFVLKAILDFLPLEDVNSFSKVNRDCNEIYKIYIHWRIQVEIARINHIEQENAELVQRIQQKKKEFYISYEIPFIEKESAIKKLTEISALDVTEIKTLKGRQELLDLCAVPFIILFEELFYAKKIDIKNSKISNWKNFTKLLLTTDFFKILSEYPVEVVPASKMKALEKFFDKAMPNLNEVQKTSIRLYRLLNWLQGLIEIHRFIRKFYVSLVDEEFLDKEEQEFCRYLDRLQLRSYMILRSIERFSEDYHEKAKTFINTLQEIENSKFQQSQEQGSQIQHEGESRFSAEPRDSYMNVITESPGEFRESTPKPEVRDFLEEAQKEEEIVEEPREEVRPHAIQIEPRDTTNVHPIQEVQEEDHAEEEKEQKEVEPEPRPSEGYRESQGSPEEQEEAHPNRTIVEEDSHLETDKPQPEAEEKPEESSPEKGQKEEEKEEQEVQKEQDVQKEPEKEEQEVQREQEKEEQNVQKEEDAQKEQEKEEQEAEKEQAQEKEGQEETEENQEDEQ